MKRPSRRMSHDLGYSRSGMYDSSGRYTLVNDFDVDDNDELIAVDDDYDFDAVIDHEDFGRMSGFAIDEELERKKRMITLIADCLFVIIAIIIGRLLLTSSLEDLGFGEKEYLYTLSYSEFVNNYIGDLMWSESYSEYIDGLRRYMQYDSLSGIDITGKLIKVYDTPKDFSDITSDLRNFILKGELALDNSINDLLSVNPSVKRLSGNDVILDVNSKIIGVSYKSVGYQILGLNNDGTLVLYLDNVLRVPAGWVYELLLYLKPIDKKEIIHNLYVDEPKSVATQLLCRQELLDRGEIALKKSTAIDTTRPVIYIYPTQPIDVSIEVKDIKKAVYFPEYANGFRVTVYPDGSLVDKTGRIYKFLYWEGIGDDAISMSRGFVVKQEDLEESLRLKLVKIGLDDREINDLISYWVPLLKGYEYVQFTFQSSNFEDSLKLRIDTDEHINEIRVFVLFKGLNAYKEIPNQDVEYMYSNFDRERKGLTVVEWGGALVNSNNKRIN